MGDLEEEFKGKLPDWAVALLTKTPSELDAIIDANVNAVTSLAEAKKLMRRYLKRTARFAWFIAQIEIQGR